MVTDIEGVHPCCGFNKSSLPFDATIRPSLEGDIVATRTFEVAAHSRLVPTPDSRP